MTEIAQPPKVCKNCGRILSERKYLLEQYQLVHANSGNIYCGWPDYSYKVAEVQS